MSPRDPRLLLPVALLPCAFVLASVYLVLGPPGAAGHGWGIQASWRLALPAVLVFGQDCTLAGIVIAGVVQYALLGLLVSLFLARSRRAG